MRIQNFFVKQFHRTILFSHKFITCYQTLFSIKNVDLDLSQLSDISHDLDLNALSPQPMLGSQLSLNAVAGSVQLGTSSI